MIREDQYVAGIPMTSRKNAANEGRTASMHRFFGMSCACNMRGAIRLCEAVLRTTGICGVCAGKPHMPRFAPGLRTTGICGVCAGR